MASLRARPLMMVTSIPRYPGEVAANDQKQTP
jgi:hypothetical protein